MNKKYTTLLMDVDNTLLDFDEAEHRGIREVMRAFGIEPTEEREQLYKKINRAHWEAFERGDITREQIFERRYPRFFAEFGIQVDPAKAEDLYRAQLDSCSALIDGALELCSYLKHRYDLYIITNGVCTTQYRRLADSTLDQYFTKVFVSEEAGSQKPRKEFFDYCLPRIAEKDLSRMLVIGDSLTSDIQGGINAGIDTCWFNRTNTPSTSPIHPTYEVHSLAELQKMLCKLISE